MIADEQLHPVRQACVEVFDVRDQQAWPPTVTAHAHWPLIYNQALASVSSLGLAADVQTAAEVVTDFVQRVDRARA